MSSKKEHKATRPGFATPDITTSGETGAPSPDAPIPAPAGAGAMRAPQGGPFDHTPMVEIEVIHQHGSAPSTELPFQTLEVWTQNNIYVMDPSMLCVAVRERGTMRNVDAHPFLGRRLVGGQANRGATIELSYPFPRPGTEAVFEHAQDRHRGGFSQTSTVNRVVLRLHVVTVTPNTLMPTWAEITHSTGSMPPQPPTNPLGKNPSPKG